MTTLVLSVRRGPAPAVNQMRHISSGAFQVGRAAPSDWVLADPRCVLSKRHCVFHQDERGWSVTDVSRNGSFLLRGEENIPLDGSRPHRLEPGERLRLGDYELAVDLQDEEGSFRATPLCMPQPAGSHPMRVSPPPEIPPFDMPPRQQAHPGADREHEPTRVFLQQAAAAVRAATIAATPPPAPQAASAADPARPDGGLSALLEGALLARDDVRAPGAEADVLRAAGATLRTVVSEIRRLRVAMLGEPHETATGDAGGEARPLAEARSERDALRWLLADERRYDVPPGVVIEAAFAEFRQHHDLLVRTARRSLRAMFESLDPDDPERHLLPHWLDLLPGWRRARGAVLARRRYRRLRGNLEQVVDQTLARSYREIRREAEARWTPR